MLERAEALADALLLRRPDQQAQELATLDAEDPTLARHVRYLMAGADTSAQARWSAAEERFRRSLDETEDARNLRGNIGRFVVKRPLGSGGSGAVYLAEREQVGGLVALKVLLRAEERESFLREQRIHASLIHPGIPRFHHGDPDSARPYFALEYVEGLPITKHCEQHRANLRERLRLMREVCQAVAYAQTHYIHRDLKPDNILVKAEDAGAFSVRVLDFGVALPLGGRASAGGALSTAEATAPGGFTYGYAAPEQYVFGPLSPATDVYALGVLLYELLSTRHPFGDIRDPTRYEEIVQQALAGSLPKVSQAARYARVERVLGRVSASAWRDLDRLVDKAMRVDPSERYQNVAELLADLENFEHARPLAARPPTLPYRVGKFVRRHPVLVLVSLAFTVLTTTFVTQLWSAYSEAHQQAESARRATRFMSLALTGGEWSAAPRRDLTLGEVLDRLVAASDLLSGDPRLKAELLARAGNLYAALGRYEYARTLLREAVALRTQALGPNAAEVGWDHFGLAEVERQLGEHARASQHAQKALAVADPVLRVLATVELGRGLNAQGKHVDAAQFLARMDAQLSGSKLPAELVDGVRYELANAYRLMGRLDEAERLHEASLTLARAQGQAPSIAESLLSLADLDEARGRPEQALKRAQEAATLFEKYYGAEHPDTLGALTLAARLWNSVGEHEKAAEVSQRVLTARAALQLGDHEQEALALHALCTAELALERAEAALGCARRVRALEEKLHQNEAHPHLVRALEHNTLALLLQNDREGAEQLLRDALRMVQALSPQSALAVAQARVHLGQLLARTARCAEGRQELMSALELLAKLEPPPHPYRRAAQEALTACQASSSLDVGSAY